MTIPQAVSEIGLSPANVDELRRIGVTLDNPDEVARAYGHRVNRAHFDVSPRVFLPAALNAYKRIYLHALYPALTALLASAGWRTLRDFQQRQRVRDIQAECVAIADARLASVFRKAARVVGTPTTRYPGRWNMPGGPKGRRHRHADPLEQALADLETALAKREVA